MKIKPFIIPFFALLCSCGDEHNIDFIPKEPIRDVQFIQNVKSISELFKETGQIRLDSVNEAILYNCRFSKFIDSTYIFVSDFSAIKVFDKKGKFVHKIEKKGNGPGEYNSLISVSSSPSILGGYDNSLSSVYLFNSMNGDLINSFRVKYSYRQMCLYKDSLIIMLRRGAKKDKYCTFDFYDKKGNIVYTDKSIIISDPRQFSAMPNGNIILEVFGKFMYFISPDNLIIRCYNIIEKRIEWCSNYLPNIITLEKINESYSLERAKQWVNDYEMLYGFMMIDSKLLLLQTKHYILFYDANGNYLNHLKYRDNLLKLKWFSPFSDGHSVYQLVEPEVKKIASINSNYRLIRYDYLHQK